jgi:hypothetical protein
MQHHPLCVYAHQGGGHEMSHVSLVCWSDSAPRDYLFLISSPSNARATPPTNCGFWKLPSTTRLSKFRNCTVLHLLLSKFPRTCQHLHQQHLNLFKYSKQDSTNITATQGRNCGSSGQASRRCWRHGRTSRSSCTASRRPHFWDTLALKGGIILPAPTQHPVLPRMNQSTSSLLMWCCYAEASDPRSTTRATCKPAQVEQLKCNTLLVT